MRTYTPSPTVRAPKIPLYQLGWLGADATSTAIQASGQVAGKIVSGAITSSASQGTWLASAAGPIGAAVAIVAAIGAGMWAAHEARKKQAKDENSALNLAVNGFDQDMRAINQDFNSGQIDAGGAIQLLQEVKQRFWDLVTPHIQPGRNGCQSGAYCPSQRPSNYCSGNIGAACCAGCSAINPSIDEAIAILSGNFTKIAGDPEAVCPCPLPNGWRSIVREIFKSQYGGLARSPYTLDWIPPGPSAAAPSAATGVAPGGTPAAAVASFLTQAQQAVSGSNWLMWLALGGLGLLALRRFAA